jgi:hypothetical protein
MKAITFTLTAALHSLALAGPTPTPGVPTPPVAANPLSFADGRVTFSVENQTRFEFRENTFDFDKHIDSINDDSFFLNRFRVGLEMKPIPSLTLFFQAQDSREMDSDRPNIPGQLGAEGDNPFDLRQAYVEWNDSQRSPFSLKVGRQVLLYGDQRLIGPLEWSNLSRTFDAVKLRWSGADGLWVDAFVSSVVVPDRNGMDQSDRDSLFSGLYAHLPKTGPQDTEIYLLHLNDDDRDDHFLTLGTHAKSHPGALGPWDYEMELAYQNGTAGGQDLSAFASYVEAGYTLDATWKPRIGLEYSFGSGDGNGSDDKQGAFQNLFPTNHPHYGLMDLFSWSNLHDAVLHLSAKPMPTITCAVDVHAFWLADTGDAWRRANARTAVRPVSGSADSFAGSEVDAMISWKPLPSFSVTAGYSHFFAGNYLSSTGQNDDADFVYVMTGIQF